MAPFQLDRDALAAQRERAARQCSAGGARELLSALRLGERIDDTSLTALWMAENVPTAELLEVARSRRNTESPRIETFSPLYITNECDAECAMCGMRSFNRALERETADAATVRSQLEILFRRGLRGVAILTGEYGYGARRQEMLARTSTAARDAIEIGFTHVLINVGSIETGEYGGLLEGLPLDGDGSSRARVTMCTFQETYDRDVYGRFMGSSPANPRSDYQRRLQNFDRAGDAGLRSANPGILLGLNRDLGYELLALLAHVRHLRERGMTVYVSLPRLRKASGAPHHAGVSDDELIRIVSLLAAGVPEARVVISTRESPEIQKKLLPVIAVLTAGSPGVAPYDDGDARFDLNASQFEVADQRPIETILGDCLAAGAIIDGYVPAARPELHSQPAE